MRLEAQELTRRSYPYIILVTIAIFLALGAASMALNKVLEDRLSQGYMMEYVFFTGLVQVVLSAIVIQIMKKNQVFYPDEFTSRGLLEGIKLGWLAYIFSAALFTLNYLGQDRSLFTRPSFLSILIVLFSALATGFFEEVLVRGFVLNSINEKLQGVPGGTKKAMLISSAIFALAHLFNLLMNPDLFFVIANVIQAFMMGLYLSAIYVRSGNLIAPSIIHGIVDFATFIFYAILSPEALSSMMNAPQTEPTASPWVTFFVQIAITIPFLISGLLMMKKIDDKTA